MNRTNKSNLRWLLIGAVVCASASVTVAQSITVRVGDLTKIKGQRTNTLVGMGLVTGLSGTGDGDDYLPTMRSLMSVMGRLANPITTIDELGGSDNVAIVMLEATIPEFGAREGDRIDVKVTTLGSCKSLENGRLLTAPLLYHDRAINDVYAFASGPIRVLGEDGLTSGIVPRGATIERDVLLHFLARSSDLPFSSTWIVPDYRYITLVIDDNHASWAIAHEIATAINTELSDTADLPQVAQAMDPKNVVVLVPNEQDVAAWIREVERTVVLVPEGEARVVVDRSSGTIVVSGDARISPVIISQRGLTITVVPPRADGEQPRPVVSQSSFVTLDPSSAADVHVGDLLEALKPLNVPVEDRIEILTKVHRLGKLHADLIFEE